VEADGAVFLWLVQVGILDAYLLCVARTKLKKLIVLRKEEIPMIKSLIDKWRAKQALKELEKDPIYQVAINSIRETFSDKSAGLGKYANQKFKEELAGDISLAKILFISFSINSMNAFFKSWRFRNISTPK
jgi:hypothetical protein